MFGAPGRFRGSFPDIHNAKIEIKTPESLGEALTAAFQFKPLQPLSRATTRVSIDVGELLGFKGAPTLVLNPDPPFLGGLNVLGPLTGHQRSSAPIKWNPRLELSGVTEGNSDDGVQPVGETDEEGPAGRDNKAQASPGGPPGRGRAEVTNS